MSGSQPRHIPGFALWCEAQDPLLNCRDAISLTIALWKVVLRCLINDVCFNTRGFRMLQQTKQKKQKEKNSQSILKNKFQQIQTHLKWLLAGSAGRTQALSLCLQRSPAAPLTALAAGCCRVPQGAPQPTLWFCLQTGCPQLSLLC